MDLVIATGSALGRLRYPNQSGMSSIRPISILADHELQHRVGIYDTSTIQASLPVISAVKNGFWP